MFLSIIIPVHNAERTLNRVLNSIVRQNYTEEYEIIIVDDCSTDNSLSIVDDYKDKLDIKVVPSRFDFHCAGNSRQTGIEVAKGEWITFIDHDDEFIDNAFNTVTKIIKDDDLKYYCFTLLEQKSEVDGRIVKLSSTIEENIDPWLHGKFFNRVNLIEKYDIHFKKDLFYLEDIYFMKNLMAKLYVDGVITDTCFKYYPFYTYRWYFGVSNTHANLVQGKYTHNEWGIANIYCEVLFKTYTDILRHSPTKEQFDKNICFILSSLVYVFMAKQKFIEKFGKDDTIVKTLQDNIEKYAYYVFLIDGLKESQIVSYFENSFENPNINPEFRTDILYDDILIWLGDFKKSFIEEGKRNGTISERTTIDK